MRAMILAAGYGTRLWPLTIDRTKPALPFLGQPLVGYVAAYLKHNGCDEVLVNLHHRPESVRAALGDGARFGVRLSYSEEREILGTGGALDNARRWLERETFFVVNGKIITDIDLRAALQTHREKNALATLVLLPNRKREKFSTVSVENGLIRGFGGAPAQLSSTTTDSNQISSLASDNEGRIGNDLLEDKIGADVPLMFTGIQILEPRIFDYIPRGVFSHTTTDVYPPAIAAGETIAAHVADRTWYELSTIERYLAIALAELNRRGAQNQIDPTATIDAAAEVKASLIWENANIGAGVKLDHVIVGAGVQLTGGENYRNCAIVRAELARSAPRPDKGRAGEFRGANFIVSLEEC